MRSRSVLALILFLVLHGHANEENSALLGITTRDWSQVAALAIQQGRPLMLLVGAPDCGYCLRLRNEVLYSRALRGDLDRRVLIREMDLHTGGKIVDFDGEPVRARMFLNRYGVFATPTILFLDPAGRPLREPLVGYNGTDLYLPELERAVRESEAALLEDRSDPSGKLAGRPPGP